MVGMRFGLSRTAATAQMKTRWIGAQLTLPIAVLGSGVEIQLPVLGPVEGAAGVAGVALKMPSSQRNLASSML